jgi:hypothetical protein
MLAEALGSTLRVDRARQSVCKPRTRSFTRRPARGCRKRKSGGYSVQLFSRPYDQRTRKVNEEARHPGETGLD